MRDVAITVLLFLLALSAFAQTSPPKALYAAGVSVNPGGSPMVAGTGLAARLIADSGTYAFTAIDALPTTFKPFAVTTQISGGIAQRIVTIGQIPIYVPTSAGISYNGTNAGWAWTTGAMAVVRAKGPWRVLPNVRLVKSSVSNGAGYQVIGGILIGWGE